MGEDKKDQQSVHTHTTKTIATKKTDHQSKIEVSDKTDFVLIDLRDEESFERYHIWEGSRL